MNNNEDVPCWVTGVAGGIGAAAGAIVTNPLEVAIFKKRFFYKIWRQNEF